MSTRRRSTRATSGAVSSRGASPAIIENDITATPSSRRSVRRATSSAALPRVGLRASNAYGADTIAQSATLRAPAGSAQIQNVLNGLLEPVQEAGAASSVRGGGGKGKGRATASPGADRSFDLEKNLFDSANVESSSIVSPEDPGIPELPRPRRRVPENVELPNQQAKVVNIARNTRVPRRSSNLAASGRSKIWFPRLPKWLLLSLLATFVILVATMSDLQHSILYRIRRSFPPSGPISGNYHGYEIKDLQNRMTVAESDIARLSKIADLDVHTVTTLQKILPDLVVCKKDKHGNIIIPDDFWHAMVDRLRKEDIILEQDSNSRSQQTSGLSKNDVTNIAERAIQNSEKVWDKFLENNKNRVQKWQNNDFESKVSHSFRVYADKYRQVDKDELIEAIKQNWEDTRREVQVHLDPVARKVEAYLHQITKLEHKTVGKEQVQSIASNVASRLITHAKLGALSEANIDNQAHIGLLRVNHFSRGTGAVINKELVSPNFVFPSMDRNGVIKAFHWLAGRPIPAPMPPEAALENWEEHGDCWCSPAADDRGFGPSLAVLLGNKVQPDQVIVEHIPASAAIEPGSAPKEMELLAFIEDIPTYHQIRAASDHFFSDELEGQPGIQAGWVRLGIWTYDAASKQSIQSFPLHIDLEAFGPEAFTKSVIVRAKNNWGGDAVDYTCMYRVRMNGGIVR